MQTIRLQHQLDLDALIKQFGVNFNRCFHCRCCSGGCPFTAAMDYPPNAVIRLVQFGLLDEALSCRTIWTCVACNTCSMECPMAIDIAGFMDGLRQMALALKSPIAEPDVVDFHKAVLASIAKHGRTHKFEIMLRYKLKTRTWTQDWQVGLKMLAKRKLDLAPSRVYTPDKIRALINMTSEDEPDD